MFGLPTNIHRKADKQISVSARVHDWDEVLNGHCHDDFAISCLKLLKYLTKKPFSDMKLLLEHREENIRFIRGKANYKQFLETSLQYTGKT